MMTTLKIFKNFVGNWRIKKVLGHQGSALGLASFTSIRDNKLRYKEILKVKLENISSPFSGFKTYIYEYKGGHILKRYDEDPPRLFYQLNFSEDHKKASGSHLCKADQYNADYFFKDKNHFILSYQVVGPQKNYTITSELIKVLGETDGIEELPYEFCSQ